MHVFGKFQQHTAQKRIQKVVNTSFNYKIIFKKIGIYRYQIKKFPNINTKQQTKDKYKDQLITNNQQIQIKKLSTNQQIPLNKYTSTKTNTTYSIFRIYLSIAQKIRYFTQHKMKQKLIVNVSHLQQLQHYIFEVYSSLCNKNYYHHKTIKNQKILEPATQHINKFQSKYIQQSNTTYTLTSQKVQHNLTQNFNIDIFIQTIHIIQKHAIQNRLTHSTHLNTFLTQTKTYNQHIKIHLFRTTQVNKLFVSQVQIHITYCKMTQKIQFPY
eukprot:TRINITY_DN4202_c0_g1_i10.p1 TRINITY_DN4202_c0_g1~~TRINITY_DN4202_c0_g1_i10.p1  ORF type:complete len:269 (+),score=-24.33 TRINITY_DN4202_c0_g1_i10:275-1081(+)